MTPIRLAASVVPVCLEPLSLLWVHRNDDAPALPGFHVTPGGLLEPGEAPDVAGLRELFEEVGILHAEGAQALDDDAREALREAFIVDGEEGAARFRLLGLRWRTEDLRPIGRWVTPDYARRRFDSQLYVLVLPDRPAPDPTVLELQDAEWIHPEEALARWGRGGVLLAPPMAHVIRSMARLAGVDAEDLAATHGARGERCLRWEVVPHVQMMPFRTPTLLPATHTNSYIVGSREALLVEPATPYEDEQAVMAAWIEESRAAGIAPIAMLVTHHHGDHVGAVRVMKERLGIPLWAHAETASRLPSGITVDRVIEDGERLVLDGPAPITLRALHTPGHAPGHLCLVEEASGVILVGDMVASVGTIIVEPTDGDMTAYLAQLERLRAERATLLLPAHGAPIRDPDALLAHYVAHRLAREEKVFDALTRAGAATAAELVPDAYDDAPKAVWPLAALSTEAHLIKLERDGRVRRDGAGWATAS